MQQPGGGEKTIRVMEWTVLIGEVSGSVIKWARRF